VTDVIAMDGINDHQLLALAASVESRSEHPLAQAVVRSAHQRDIAFTPAEEVEALMGRGVHVSVESAEAYAGNLVLFAELGLTVPETLQKQVEALETESKTTMIVYGPTRGEGSTPGFLGLIAVADTLREDAREAVAALKRIGIRRTVMLTGDNERTAAAIAAQAGLDDFRANLLPEDKVDAIERLLAEYGQVAMVGDGINDAPALARATVGIAMGGAGTDQALETADVALMADALNKLPFALRLSRRTLRIVRQNIGISLLVKAAFVALALPGLTTLWMAVFADMGSSLIVILNGMRLLRSRP
jgi:Cd2+/Zn2+-exporting ATPase